MRHHLTICFFTLAGVGVSGLLGLATAADEPAKNTPPAGFTALFNGKDLTNWSEEGESSQHWSARDGVLHFDGKGQNLKTAKPYKDFELYVDWKIGTKGDSGIYLRGCPQVQIWDDPVGSGGIFNNQKNPSKPSKVVDKPVGEWNTFHIILKGDRVTVDLNGQRVVEDVQMENYFDRAKPLPTEGTIELQNHGNPLEFRNIYVKEL